LIGIGKTLSIKKNLSSKILNWKLNLIGKSQTASIGVKWPSGWDGGSNLHQGKRQKFKGKRKVIARTSIQSHLSLVIRQKAKIKSLKSKGR
jgi:hypothetical protein